MTFGGERRRFWLVAVVAAICYAPTVRHRNLTDCGGSSRMATVESLVERGTFVIDGSTFAYSCDVMQIGGRLYSDKPPLLSVAASVIYAGLHHGLGLSFNPASQPLRNAIHDHTYAWMVGLVVVLAQALLVATFDRATGDCGLAGARRLLATAVAAFATLLWPLAGLFNSHTVTAALIFAGLRFALLRDPARPALAGLCLALAATVDLPLGLLAVAATFVLVPGRIRFIAGATGPLALHAFLNWWIVGDVIPFQLHRELYTAATGHTGESATGFAQDAGLARYAVRNLVGSIGLFSLTPVLPLALAWTAAAAVRSGRLHRFALVAAALFVASLGLYVVVWPEAVGCAYGMRHLTPVVTPLLLVAAVVTSPSRRAFCWFVAASAISALLAAGGMLNPTTCAGFVTDGRATRPALVFFDNLGQLLARLRGG